MFKILILLLSINGLINCLQLTDKSYKPCTEIPNTIETIDVSPCTAEPCAFTRGTVVRIQTNFKPNTAANNCQLVTTANLGAWVPILQENVCGTSVPCPLSAGVTNKIDFSTAVDDALPAGNTETKWKLVCDNTATEVFCADVTVNVN